MLILRKSQYINEYFPAKRYRPSVYNIVYMDEISVIIYNTFGGAVVLIEKDNYQRNKFSSFDMKVLVENNIFVDNDLDEYNSVIKNVNCGLKSDIDYFTIIVTTICNAKCFYCYEKSYFKSNMSESMIEKITDYISNQIVKGKSFVLDWYGGEPLLSSKQIDKIICSLDSKVNLDQIMWTSSITTNAVLFNKKTIDYAINKWKLTNVSITLDGVESEHNRRKSVSGCINAYKKTKDAISYLLERNIYVNLRIHLDEDNKSSFGEILDDLKEFVDYKNLHIFPTYLFPPEFEIPINYIKDRDKETLFYDVYKSMYEKQFIKDYIECLPWPKKENCFATQTNKVVIAPDGSLHSCVQNFQGKDWENDEQYWHFIKELGICEKCQFLPICLGGCVYNRKNKNTVRTPCVRNRYIIKPLLKLILESIH